MRSIKLLASLVLGALAGEDMQIIDEHDPYAYKEEDGPDGKRNLEITIKL